MYLISRITIHSLQSAEVDPSEVGERDTIPAHCTLPQQCLLDGISAK
jgi:hypothetical protein